METVLPVKVSFYFCFQFSEVDIYSLILVPYSNIDELWITRLQHIVQMVTTRMNAVNVKKMSTTRVGPGVLMATIKLQMEIAKVLETRL